MRFAAYVGASVSLGVLVLLRAVHERSNFYAACVFLAQSNANVMILTNLVLLGVCTVLLGLQKVLYGPLRPIETEQLYDKAWFAITETCLAMTIFRGEVGAWFIVMFVCLLVGKVWGWIGEGRVEILEQQPPVNPRLFHARLSTSLLLSLFFDFYLLNYCAETVLQQARPDMMVMFGFEFAVLSISSTSTFFRYTISLAEIYIVQKQKRLKLEERRREIRETREVANNDQAHVTGEVSAPIVPHEQEIDEMDLDVPGWEDKGRWIFYLDLTTDFLKLVVYLSFFFILLTFYGLPIHIMRDVFLTIRSFFKRIADFVRYRNATRDMNERYPDATAAEISREDTCIICREEMTPWEPHGGDEANHRAGPRRAPGPMAERMRPKKLPCGHILHFACLRSWLERQQNCPTCRRPVLATNRITVIPDPPGQNNGGQGVPAALQPQIPGANLPQGADGQNAQNRARIINFGPFRIGFGAGNHNLFQDLAQQVHDGAPRPVDAGAPNDGGPRQIGFGFGFGRPNIQPNPAQTNSPATTAVEAQLEQIERQIMQEVSRLRVSADQLQAVRSLQRELIRLRNTQPNLTPNPGALPANATSRTVNTYAVPYQPNAGTSPHPPAPVGSGIPNVHGATFTPSSPALGQGNPSLPPGVTLPPGWTLTPLQRLGGSARPGGNTPSTLHSSSAPALSSSGPSFLRNTSNVQNSDAEGQQRGPSVNELLGLAEDQRLPLQIPLHNTSSHERADATGVRTDGATQGESGAIPDIPHQPIHSSISDLNLAGRTIPATANPLSQGYTSPPAPVATTSEKPSWGSVHETASEIPPTHEQDLINGPKENISAPAQETEQGQPSEEVEADSDTSRAKGKARAATVEDFIGDVD